MDIVAGQIVNATAPLGLVEAPVGGRVEFLSPVGREERASQGHQVPEDAAVDQLACFEVHRMVTELESFGDEGVAVVYGGHEMLRFPGRLSERFFTEDGLDSVGASEAGTHLCVKRPPGTDDGDVDFFLLQHFIHVEIGRSLHFGVTLPIPVDRILRNIAERDELGSVRAQRSLGVCAGNSSGAYESDSVDWIGH